MAHAEPYSLTLLPDDVRLAALNDAGNILELRDPTSAYRNAFPVLRLPSGQEVPLGQSQVDVGPISFTQNNALAAVRDDGAIVVYRPNLPEIRVKTEPTENLVVSLGLSDSGTLASIEYRSNAAVPGYYASTYTNVFTNPTLTGDAILPNAAYGYNIFVAGGDRVLVYSDILDSSPAYFLMNGSTYAAVPESSLPARAQVYAVLPSGRVLFGLRGDSNDTTGRLFTSDLSSAPVALNPQIPLSALQSFAADAGNEAGITAGHDYNGGFGFYGDSFTPLALLVPGQALRPLDCYFSNSVRVRFTHEYDYYVPETQVNASGLILTHARLVDAPQERRYAVLTPIPGGAFNNFCPNISVKLLPGCGGSGRRSSAQCKAAVKVTTAGGQPISNTNVQVLQYGTFTPDGDGGYYPGPGLPISKTRTTRTGTATVGFKLGRGARLYEVVTPFGSKIFRSKAATFEISR